MKPAYTKLIHKNDSILQKDNISQSHPFFISESFCLV